MAVWCQPIIPNAVVPVEATFLPSISIKSPVRYIS
nr:MAG TPA: hypothetical protein [Caudoviricetes sp.]